MLLEESLGGLTAIWCLLHGYVHTVVLCPHVFVLRHGKLDKCLALRLCQEGGYWPLVDPLVLVLHIIQVIVILIVIVEVSLLSRWLILNLDHFILNLAPDHLFELIF